MYKNISADSKLYFNNINFIPKERCFVKDGDERHNIIVNLIDDTFSSLIDVEKKIICQGMVFIVNLLAIKFNKYPNNQELFWTQLIQNNMLDLQAIIRLILPFIDDPNGSKKKNLLNLKDIYLATDESGEYIYTTVQYARCYRYILDGELLYIKRPYTEKVFLHNLILLAISVDLLSNKLYVNWEDVHPIPIDLYRNSDLYKETVNKIKKKNYQKKNLYLSYIDLENGLSICDIYHTIRVLLYEHIKNIKWLIYDLFQDIKKTFKIPIILYLEKNLNIQTIYEKKQWSQIGEENRQIFISNWNDFLSDNLSVNGNTNIVIYYIYIFFYNKYSLKYSLKKQGYLNSELGLDVDKNDNLKFNEKNLELSKLYISKIPPEDIYKFLYEQIRIFKKTWYFYIIKEIGCKNYINFGPVNVLTPVFQDSTKNPLTNRKPKVFLTAKNIYNYCKSFSYVNRNDKQKILPKHWYTLHYRYLNTVIVRIYDLINENEWKDGNWFDNSRYWKRFGTNLPSLDMKIVNYEVHLEIRNFLIDIIFQAMIYKGFLSNYVPDQRLSDKIISQSTNRFQIIGEKITENIMKNCWYFYTGEKYPKTYPDYLTDPIKNRWTSIYGLNWLTQINVFNKFYNCRVSMYTGDPGVGKSTQQPKLFAYFQYIIGFANNVKILCTEPRILPTKGNAETISTQLNLPISTGDVRHHDNMTVQYKFKGDSHISTSDVDCPVIIRIITDGTFFEELVNSPFLTKTLYEKGYYVDSNGKKIFTKEPVFTEENEYDCIIIDESHENNVPINLILSLMYGPLYVNNSLKLMIMSATMKIEEKNYRRFFRNINNNRSFPLCSFLKINGIDRANIDNRVHVSEPGSTSRFEIIDHFPTESELVNYGNIGYLQSGINKTLKILKEFNSGNVLLFMPGTADVVKAVDLINNSSDLDVIAFPLYSKMSEKKKKMVTDIENTLKNYIQKKDFRFDVDLVAQNNDFVPTGTYKRAVIVATNIAEASITIPDIVFVVDTGLSKTEQYNILDNENITVDNYISESSALQRRGRTGRVCSGHYYPLFDFKILKNVPNSYKISEQDIGEHLLKMVESNRVDLPLVYGYKKPNFFDLVGKANDINSVYTTAILAHFDSLPDKDHPPNFVYYFLGNPRSLLPLIESKYLRSPDLNYPSDYFNYFGQYSINSANDSSILESQFPPDSFFDENMDDYISFYKPFISRSVTGYSSQTILDREFEFYIFHPDENIIQRDYHTGKVIGLKYDKNIPNLYYQKIFEVNNISTNDLKRLENDKKEYEKFINNYKFKYPVLTPKTTYYFQRYFNKLYIIPNNSFPELINYANIANLENETNKKDIQNKIVNYFNSVSKLRIKEINPFVKSEFLYNLEDLRNIVTISIFENFSDLLWYAYALAKNVSDDVLAVMTFIKNIGSISELINTEIEFSSFRSGVKKRDPENNRKIKNTIDTIRSFYRLNITEKGDLYFYYKLWTNIRESLKLSITKLFDSKIIIESIINDFYILRSKFNTDKSLLSPTDIALFSKLETYGHLYDRDAIYYYLDNLKTIPIIKSYLQNENNNEKIITNIAKALFIRPEILLKCITQYYNYLFFIEKTKYIRDYEIKYGLKVNRKIEQINDWIKDKLTLPSVFEINNNYDLVLETFIRSHSSNLVYSGMFKKYLIKINTGSILKLVYPFWNSGLKHPYNEFNDTLISNLSFFMIYYNIISRKKYQFTKILVPIKIEWAIKLDPLYYLSLLLTTYSIDPDDFDVDDRKIYYVIRKILVDNVSGLNKGFINEYILKSNNNIMKAKLENMLSKIK